MPRATKKRTPVTPKKQPAPVLTKDEFKELQRGDLVTITEPENKTFDIETPDADNLPHVTVVIVTFRRLNEIRKTIDALLKHIVYPRAKLHFLIADDHSGGDYVEQIISTPRYKALDMRASVTPENGGWAKNANLALSKVETPYHFFIEDDYLLMKELDLRVGVALLETKPHIGMLRYRGTAGGHVILHQMEADISAYVPTHQDGVGLPGKLTYCLLDSGSPDLYLYSHGASLRRKSFHEFYGPYPEGLKLGATEERYAHTVKDGMHTPDAPAIAILPDWVSMWFDHFGNSYQHTEHDKGAAN